MTLAAPTLVEPVAATLVEPVACEERAARPRRNLLSVPAAGTQRGPSTRTGLPTSSVGAFMTANSVGFLDDLGLDHGLLDVGFDERLSGLDHGGFSSGGVIDNGLRRGLLHSR